MKSTLLLAVTVIVIATLASILCMGKFYILAIPLIIICIGGILNLIVILANGGKFPILVLHLEARDEFRDHKYYKLMNENTKFKFLADIHSLSVGGDYCYMFCLGDILCIIGFISLIFAATVFLSRV